VDGIIGEALNTGSAVVEPPDASLRTITWSVKTAGAGIAASAVPPFIPADPGNLTLTATVTGGAASGGDYTKDFPLAVTRIRKVTGIAGIASLDHLAKDYTVDLNIARVNPANATNKTIVWTVENAGAGVASISGDKRLVLTEAGTLELRAVIVNGDENAGVLGNYTKVFSFTVDNASAGGGVAFEEDAFIKLYANGGADPLPEGGTFTVVKDTEYYIGIDAGAGYTNIVWRLNGKVSTVDGGKLYLDTKIAGTVVVTVEAEKDGNVDDGACVFIIQ
jgi:hypothetical protein